MAYRTRVGIVEDDELVATTLEAMLKDVGCTAIAVARTYEDAIALVEGATCEMVFVDLRLDGKESGIDIAQRAVRRGAAVIVTTGVASLPDELSGVALLLKPFSADQVRHVLHAIRKPRSDLAPA